MEINLSENMILQRKEAILLASFIQMFQLSVDVREKKTEDAICEAEVENLTEAEKNLYLRKYLEEELRKVKNSYLEKLLFNVYRNEIKVVGEEPKLSSCPCCDYNTLEKRGEYFICPVCFWEDDGDINTNRFSSVNKMTLEDAKHNFKLFGVVKKEFLKFLYEDRTLRYERKAK